MRQNMFFVSNIDSSEVLLKLDVVRNSNGETLMLKL